jgi:hypothetical protein
MATIILLRVNNIGNVETKSLPASSLRLLSNRSNEDWRWSIRDKLFAAFRASIKEVVERAVNEEIEKHFGLESEDWKEVDLDGQEIQVLAHGIGQTILDPNEKTVQRISGAGNLTKEIRFNENLGQIELEKILTEHFGALIEDQVRQAIDDYLIQDIRFALRDRANGGL